jgi:hypothetical protein
MKKLTILASNLTKMLMVALMATTIFSCSEDDDNSNGGDDENVLEVSIPENTTLEADKKYTLKGNVFVPSGVTLTIEPGTVIVGDKATKGALIIERGAKIMAEGTADEPIVFTSSAAPGNRNYGDWGGLVILGKAVNNKGTDVSIEGITASNKGLYGGNDDADNSGVLQYVRIEFAGIALSTDNELNGLTLGSVGSGTTIDHIQVSYSGDDSFEWFGGTVNATHLVAYRGWDDDFDTDYGYRGKVQFAVSFRDPNQADKSGSNGLESDNNGTGGAETPKTAPIFANLSWFGPYASTATLSGSGATADYQFAGHLRRNSDIKVYNSIFVGSKLEGIHFDKTGPAAEVKGNYFGRTGVSVSKAVSKVTTGNNFDASTFDGDNRLEADQATVDLSSKITGLAAALNLAAPSGLLANGSTLLSDAKTVPAGITQTSYIGAFDATNNWMEDWTNFSPDTTEY